MSRWRCWSRAASGRCCAAIEAPAMNATKPALDGKALIREAARRLDLSTRRAFLRQSLGLGSLVMLAGCDLTDDAGAENFLSAVSRFNDRVQAWLFDPAKLAPEYPESAITDPFP